jgi:transposase, IS30 family
VLREFVAVRLKKRWSPEQISHDLRVEFPNQPEWHLVPETIYQAVYRPELGGLARQLPGALRTGRRRRKPHRRPDARRAGSLTEMTMIDQRPAEATDRSEPGHWEGDLITGEQNRSAIGTLVDRHSRFTMLLHLPGRHTAEAVRDALVAAFAGLPPELRRSLTWDQGKELAMHAQIAEALGMPVFFCDPHSPWQRPSNENTNGLLRQYFPKSSDLRAHDAQHLGAVATELNERPRKTLAWCTPAQLLTAHAVLVPPCPPSQATAGSSLGACPTTNPRHPAKCTCPAPRHASWLTCWGFSASG